MPEGSPEVHFSRCRKRPRFKPPGVTRSPPAGTSPSGTALARCVQQPTSTLNRLCLTLIIQLGVKGIVRTQVFICFCSLKVLLDLGRFKEAEEEFRSSLLEYPESPFALWGLRAALEAQDDVNGTADAESDGLSKRIATAWKSADVKLTSACPALTAPPKFNAARLAKLTCPAGLVSSGPALRDPEIRVHHGLKAGQTANQVAGSKRVF